METRYAYARDIVSAREDIFNYIRHNRDKKVIYFNGWKGFGAAPVLRSIAQVPPSIKAKKTPPELSFDRIIYIDCSAWESRRAMQRKIAEELGLDHETMAILDNQDAEDDFNIVDRGSRNEIHSVSQAVAEILWNRKLMMIFLNGSDDEVDVNEFGIFPGYCDHVIVWTFKTQSLTKHVSRVEIASKLRRTHTFIDFSAGSEFRAILREEAASMVARHSCMRGIDLTVVTDCYIYESFLHSSFHRATRFNWTVHASNYWMCDGIIKGVGTREIGNTLQQEICWERDAYDRLGSVLEEIMKDPKAPFLIVKDDIVYEKMPYRWIAITSKNLPAQEDMQTILVRATSLFLALEKSTSLQVLPSEFLKHCSNLGVLFLSNCAFSFVSPPFIQCHELRFLGLDHCTQDNTSEGGNNTEWTCLQNLWVLDLCYTEWDAILSEEKMDAMANLRELNIEGIMCWQLASRLQGRLPHLQRLRIIKPTRKVETSIDSTNMFVDKIELEILDLSGNKEMKNLPTSLSMARSLQMLILDGCDRLESVVVPDGLPSSLRSFSFDGYGPATHRISPFQLTLKDPKLERLTDENKRDIKTSKISLQGCKQFDNLFVRGLPNLVELDLSGSAIKVLDLNTMVVDVPGLKRLFLLGCEHLRAIRWGSMEQLNLELLCIDTRPERAHRFTRSSLAQHKHFCLYATLADARLARSLSHLVAHYQDERDYDNNIYFNIHITSSTEYGGGVVHFDAIGKEMIEPSDHQYPILASQYDDVFFKFGDASLLPFPQPPTEQLDHHIEISGESCGLESELKESHSIANLMIWYAESLHAHDASTSTSMAGGYWYRLKWCRIERCPNLVTIFPSNADDYRNKLEIIWASDLLMVQCIWSKGSSRPPSFRNLRHLHLRSCPRLQFVLPVWVASFPSLETLHIIHCSDLSQVFVLDGRYPEEITVHGVLFPKLTSIHLYNMPKLQQIMCNVKMLAPALKTIWIRGCFGLRRLPAVAAREPGARRPAVDVEKDVWDTLEWDGLAAGHHPDLFEPPVHSRYYRRRRVLRGTILR